MGTSTLSIIILVLPSDPSLSVTQSLSFAFFLYMATAISSQDGYPHFLQFNLGRH